MKRPSPARAGTTLTRKQIVEEALRLIDEEGSSAFSMRSLARRFDVTTMALYWHYRDRNALLADLTARIVSEIRLPAADLRWDTWLGEFARRYREVIHRHPNASVMIATDMATNAAADFPVAETIMSVFARGGFTGAGLIQAYNVYVLTLVGFVVVELAELPHGDPEAWAEQRRQEVASLDPSRFPTLSAHQPLLEAAAIVRWRNGTQAPLDASFDLFLKVVLTGLQATRSETAKL
jgi:TetR/AcrR family transcriptional regulator, tetracycline repressor protein